MRDCLKYHLHVRDLIWKQFPAFGCLSNDTVEEVNGIGRIDGLAYLWRVVKGGSKINPVASPGFADLRILITPFL